MKKSYPDVQQSDYADEAILKLQERDLSSAAWMYGNEFPTDVEEGMIFHNFSTHKVYNYVSGTWVEMFDYSGGYITENVMKVKYQPLNDTLTSMSLLTATGAGLIGTTAFYPVGAFGRNALLSVSSAGALRTALGLGKLALLSTAAPDTIQEGTITEDKLSSDFILQPEFTTGDVVMSVRQTARAGWIKLGSAGTDTIGVSGATYSGSTYKKLYDVLWKRADCIILNAGDEVTTKGGSSDSDWADNKKIRVKKKGYNPVVPGGYFKLLDSNGVEREYLNGEQLDYKTRYSDNGILSAVEQGEKWAYYKFQPYELRFKSSLASGELDTSVPFVITYISSFFTDTTKNLISFTTSQASVDGGSSRFVATNGGEYLADSIPQVIQNRVLYSPIVYFRGSYYRLVHQWGSFSLWRSDKLDGPYEQVAAGFDSAYMSLEFHLMSFIRQASINLSASENYLYQVRSDGIYRSEDGVHFIKFVPYDFGSHAVVSAAHLGGGVMTFCVWPIVDSPTDIYIASTPHRFLTFENGTSTILPPAATTYSIGQIIPGFTNTGRVLIFDQEENQVSIYEIETGERVTSFQLETNDSFKQVASVYGYGDEHPLKLDYSMFNQFIKL